MMANIRHHNGMDAPYFIQWIAKILWTLPSPTAAWASIIDSLAWPLVIALLVVRFRKYLKSCLDTLATRLVTDHVKFGPFELTPNSQVLVLDSDDPDPSSDFAAQDLARMEDLFEFISGSSGEAMLRRWMTENLEPTVDLSDFLTEKAYAQDREKAFGALIGDK